ncbi:MAG: hypothetical protein KIS66_17995 [Fimbriimonadaceae bacterium]|nr:hypothetical protein [Fimbriimonadaceae bacterium]
MSDHGARKRRPIGDPADWVLWWWFPIRRWETVALYRSIGMDRYYSFIIGLTRELDFRRCVQELAPGHTPLSQEDLTWFRQECRYHDAANMIRIGFLLPPFGVLAAHGAWGLAVMLLGFGLLHTYSLMLDRYKQLFLNLYEQQARDDGVELPEKIRRSSGVSFQPSPFHRVPLRWYFDPKPWESERFFLALGIGYWQRVVYYMTSKAWHPVAERREPGARTSFFREGSRQEMVDFEFATRLGETMHWLGLLTLAPVATTLWRFGSYWSSGIALFVMLTDALLVMTLRMHRARIWKLVQRVAAQAQS